jgi:hypothetical protein
MALGLEASGRGGDPIPRFNSRRGRSEGGARRGAEGRQQWRWAAAVGTHAGGGLSCFVWITRKGKSEKGGSIAAWVCY